jgi:predicted GIY-YIG superfamily endonuclease
MAYEIDLILSKRIPKEIQTSAVYALLKSNDIVYIGKTNNVNVRVKNHIDEGRKDFDDYAVIRTFSSDSSSSKPSAFESEMIRRYVPLYNISTKNGYEEFTEEVRNSNKTNKWKIAELLDRYPDITARCVAKVVDIGDKTIYKHMAALGSPQGKKHDDFDNWGVDQQDSWLDGDGSF